MRVAVVAENVSKTMSGEALLAFQYVSFMEKRGIEIELVCHERVKDELLESWSDPELKNVHFVTESRLQRWIWNRSGWLPFRVRDLIVNQILHLMTQIRARKRVIELVREKDIDIVYQPAPISPKGVSCLYDVGAPVVIGPMCGGLDFPPAFRFMDSKFSRWTVGLGRLASHVLHRIFPGKLRADALLVANCCTRKALPSGYRGQVYKVVESGVDLSKWEEPIEQHNPSEPVRFFYLGRFVDWKGVEYLVDAFSKVAKRCNAVLELVGDGESMPAVRQLVKENQMEDKVNLHGWVKREDLPGLIRRCDCLVMPSLRECGGTAILEAMAMGLPVIGTKWAGPKNYIDDTCGLLVDPASPEDFVNGLAEAMIRLAEAPDERKAMGIAARQHVKTQYFDWESKTDRVIEIMNSCLRTTVPTGEEDCVQSEISGPVALPT